MEASHIETQFCLLTGTSVEYARAMLNACGDNLELALCLETEVGGSSSPPRAAVASGMPHAAVASGTHRAAVASGMPQAAVASDTTRAAMPQQDEVRAPIAPRQDILVEGAQAHQLNRVAAALKRGATASNGWLDPFRDFKAETERQEESLMNQGRLHGDRRKIPSHGGRLEQLFQRPLHMMFFGSFTEARDEGVRSNKWLMVNYHDKREFGCQVLNRDIWANAAIESVVQAHFIFQQLDVESENGIYYQQFYSVDRLPYVSVVDPRTGELLKVWHSFEGPYFAEQLLAFLHKNAHPYETISPPLKRLRSETKPSATAVFADDGEQEDEEDDKWTSPEGSLTSDSASSTSSSTMEAQHNVKEMEVIPQQIETEDVPLDKREAFENVVPFLTMPRTLQLPSVPETSSSKVTLCLKFSDSPRLIISYETSTKLKVFHDYLADLGYPMTHYDYSTCFPKRLLSDVALADCTLKSLGIEHSETIFIGQRSAGANVK